VCRCALGARLRAEGEGLSIKIPAPNLFSFILDMPINRLKNNDPYPGFVPVPNRGYFTLGSIPEEEKEKLEENLEIPSKMEELQTAAHQRWAQVPHEKSISQSIIQVYEYAQFYLGIMYLVSTEDDDCHYAVCLMPTKNDVDDYKKDWEEIRRKAGLQPEIWKN
jgi:hypothetical protein